MKKALLFITCISLSLSAYAGRPKIGPGYTPGIGEGNTTGGGSNTEVTLPVGLPLSGEDPAIAPSYDPSGSSNIVYTFDLNNDNGAASVNQTHSAFEKARNMNASCVLIRIDGFAGGWDVAENIRQEILDYDKPVMVYVNDRAIPAASFISSGADSVYTRKGTTLANRKAKAVNSKVTATEGQHNSGKQSSSVSGDENKSGTNTSYSEFSSDVTMNEILYKAGLGNLTVVQHDAGLAEKTIAFLTNPFVVLLALFLAGFVFRKVISSRIPGPMMYALALVLLITLAPFQLAGLASGIEIASILVLTMGLIIATRKKQKLSGALLLCSLAIVFTLVRVGDLSALITYGSMGELLVQTSLSFGLILSGWFLGRMTTSKSGSVASLSVQSQQQISSAA